LAVTLGFEALQGVLPMPEAITLLERAFANEAAGQVKMSPKFVTDFTGGSMRILFAADGGSGYCAIKAYHNIQGAGVRYVVSLYRLKDGELLALLDGRHITDLRTGAASGVIARKVAMPGPVTVGLIGSGHQAATQLEALAAVYKIRSAAVFSPTVANREAFSRKMSARLGFPVKPVDSARAAAEGHPVVAAASSARGAEPVLRGEWLGSCRLLCAVGNTRAQFAEVDVRCFQDARLVVVDSIHALQEAGELKQAIAAGALPEAKRATLGQIVTGTVTVPGAGLIVFKSVGTALQDLALAARYYELIGTSAGVPTATDLASVK
jgi:ornithine cyclodeaminase/alanine dehydrogenase-like protein (mu-crystallin family)